MIKSTNCDIIVIMAVISRIFIRAVITAFLERRNIMKYSAEVENMCPLAKGTYHGPAPIPQEGKWTQAKEVSDISGLTHGMVCSAAGYL